MRTSRSLKGDVICSELSSTAPIELEISEKVRI
jgi:hypothetical protein